MDGILIIDKPEDWTSHDVVARLRRVLKTKRIGHTGTLDPFATGVLVMLVGKATRLAQFLDKDVKEYEAVVRFGFGTDTGDRTGEARRSQVPNESKVPNESQVEEPSVLLKNVKDILPQFRGEIEQIPPMYSAKKVAGKKLYELARKGVEIERKPVPVTIAELEVIEPPRRGDAGEERKGEEEKGRGGEESGDSSFTTHDSRLSTWDLGLRVVCSAGTYIRTLAEDIGRAVGTGAHLAELRRTRAGRFKLDRAVTLEEFGSLENPAEILVSMNEAVSHLPEIKLNDEELAKIRNGVKIPARIDTPGVQIVRLTAAGDELIAMGFHDENERVIRPRLVF
jgi:tRNA pseudouridine55 synthase